MCSWTCSWTCSWMCTCASTDCRPGPRGRLSYPHHNLATTCQAQAHVPGPSSFPQPCDTLAAAETTDYRHAHEGRRCVMRVHAHMPHGSPRVTRPHTAVFGAISSSG